MIANLSLFDSSFATKGSFNNNGQSAQWWSALKHGGLLIAPAKLSEFFPEGEIEDLPRYLEELLRKGIINFNESDRSNLSTSLNRLCDTVLEGILELKKEWWTKHNIIDSSWKQKSMTGEMLKPQRLYSPPGGVHFAVFIDSETTKLGIGRGKRAVSRVLEWLRKADQKLGLITNGRQWRLIYAGLDYDAWCEWDTDLWFEEGKPGLQVVALRQLLGRSALVRPPETGERTSRLLQAVEASRQAQAELSGDLGERVREAVELLIRGTQLGEQGTPGVSNRDLYIAATRTIMRCVVILFAEARDLLPRENPVYQQSYSVQGLWEQLMSRTGGRSGERLRNGYSAWPRILALFQLVYEGSWHSELPVPRYGGRLFAPGDENSEDGVVRAVRLFENPETCLSDSAVYELLRLLTRSRVKVRQGRGNTWVEVPVDFSGLSSEYIGILYEGLLDFELRRVGADSPIAFLAFGDQPALPLQRLEEMSDKEVKNLVEKLKKQAKPTLATEEEEAEGDDEDEDLIEEEEEEEVVEELPEEEEEETQGEDLRLQFRQRALSWGVRAVKLGGLVSKPRSKKAEVLAEYDRSVETAAKGLIGRVLLPGEWFLVRWGGTRKGSGTFYTRPQLAVPTVRRTLQPLAYDADGMLKTPEEILGLKVCDPACGSGSFLIAALGFLTGALFESLFVHGWLVEVEGGTVRVGMSAEARPQWFAECVKDLPLGADDGSISRNRLKRYVVERCIYGVDLDALAVELARLSLWVETMDRNLPFSFLDHKVKCGNSLVGCWFDQFQDYPVMAWERDGGDANHTKFVGHFREHTPTSGKKKGKTVTKGDKWHQAIKDLRGDAVKKELESLLDALDPTKPQLVFPDFSLPKLPGAIHDEAMGIFQEWHNLPIDYGSELRKENEYEAKFRRSEAIRRLRGAFDAWCSVWFWPGDRLEIAPTPQRFFNLTPEMLAVVEELAERYRFFHWELEFPDVFARAGDGFDAVVGNPPWEIQKPNSMEFFSNIDPLYRTYGKQEALQKQQEYFEADSQIEEEWLLYCDRFKALSNWSKYAGFPFGDPEIDEGKRGKFSISRSSKVTAALHDFWRNRRNGFISYADRRHPFRYQGSADINTYKLFLELGLALLRRGGYLGLIVPSGIYTDKGSTDLRGHFLGQCTWEWLFVFENREKIFDIHRSFKFGPTILQKGGKTEAIKTAFMQHSLAAWEDAEGLVFSYPRERVEQFSPNSRAILEIKGGEDLRILEKMYGNGVLLGDDGLDGWGIKYAREFDMTNDSKLFPPRPQWEAKGYRPDEYGHWLKGDWREYEGPRSILNRSEGSILSADGTAVIEVDGVEDVALPLYQGIMIRQFDFSAAKYLSGAGKQAKWEGVKWSNKTLAPQFLMSWDVFKGHGKDFYPTRLSFRDITNGTNKRTFISAIIPKLPCGNKVPFFCCSSIGSQLKLVCAFNSFSLDFVLRQKFSTSAGGGSLNPFILYELPILKTNSISSRSVARLLGSISLPGVLFALAWLRLRESLPQLELEKFNWYQLWALTPHERLRLRCILDAVVAELYGLDTKDLAYILKDCDLPQDDLNSNSRNLDPKGFWRVDRDKPPEMRHTVLTLVAFHELKKLGLENFLNLNNGEGWMLPDKLRLADYDLGRDNRATEYQPVAPELGERYLPWQLEGTVEDSWEECRRHADNLKKLLGDSGGKSEPEEGKVKSKKKTEGGENIEPIQLELFEKEATQLKLF